MHHEILCAGFGGQGILFSGKLIAYIGMLKDQEISWLPSYGPEMRGGTANCSVIISDTAVGSPLVLKPSALMVMNLPSLDKFEETVIPGGKIFIDSSLVTRSVERTDVKSYSLPATGLANEHKFPKLANVIMVGKMIKELELCDLDFVRTVVEKVVPAGKPELVDLNMKAIRLGYDA